MRLERQKFSALQFEKVLASCANSRGAARHIATAIFGHGARQKIGSGNIEMKFSPPRLGGASSRAPSFSLLLPRVSSRGSTGPASNRGTGGSNPPDEGMRPGFSGDAVDPQTRCPTLLLPSKVPAGPRPMARLARAGGPGHAAPHPGAPREVNYQSCASTTLQGCRCSMLHNSGQLQTCG